MTNMFSERKNPPTTMRRMMQQVIHCVEEARDAYQEQEHKDHVLADLRQAQELLNVVITAVEAGRAYVV